MLENASPAASVTGWHRKLLTAAAVFIILLISAGGVLCVTQSIRGCPDWPGCFGKLYPPLEASPILEYIHRILAAGSGAFDYIDLDAIHLLSHRRRWEDIAIDGRQYVMED